MDTPGRARDMLAAMARGNVLAPDCPSRPVLQHLTSRWGVLVMAVLATGTHRFAELRRRIGGVSERMLAQTLQQLEADGLVLRRDHGEVPPRVDYSLTPPGLEAAGHLVRGGERNSLLYRVPKAGDARPRAYRISRSILDA